jgi:hypothetical protein
VRKRTVRQGSDCSSNAEAQRNAEVRGENLKAMRNALTEPAGVVSARVWVAEEAEVAEKNAGKRAINTIRFADASSFVVDGAGAGGADL